MVATAVQQRDVLMLPAHVLYILASVAYTFNLSAQEANSVYIMRTLPQKHEKQTNKQTPSYIKPAVRND